LQDQKFPADGYVAAATAPAMVDLFSALALTIPNRKARGGTPHKSN
jgi:hypothetical protein